MSLALFVELSQAKAMKKKMKKKKRKEKPLLSCALLVDELALVISSRDKR